MLGKLSIIGAFAAILLPFLDGAKDSKLVPLPQDVST
jgi:hypothetical protein